MTHISHPYGYRLGITKNWKSVWFSNSKKLYRDMIREDIIIRDFLDKELKDKSVDLVVIERSKNNLNIIIKTLKPGFIIGRDGQGIQLLTDKLKLFSNKNNFRNIGKINIAVEEIKYLEHSSKLVAESVAELLQKRFHHRRVLKQMVEKVISNREIKGIRIQLSGRLSGAEIASSEEAKRGNIPLQTIRANVDYHYLKTVLPAGVLGVKVWIYKGDYRKDKSLSEEI